MRFSEHVFRMVKEPSPIREIMKMAERENIINMGIDPDEFISFGGGWVNHQAPDELREAYLEIASDDQNFHVSGGYSPTPGLIELREKICEMERLLFGVKAGAKNVIIGQSSTQLTADLFLSIVDRNDKVILLDPTYANYVGQIKLLVPDARIVRVKVFDENSWTIDEENAMEGIKKEFESGAKLLIFPSPDNPTSHVFSDDFVNCCLDCASDACGFVILDYAYKTQAFVSPPKYYSYSPSEYPNLIAIYSNSKWCRGLGRRLGWVIGSEEVIEVMERVQQATILCPDSLHQMAFLQYLNFALQNKTLKKYLDVVRKQYMKAAQVTIEAIENFIGEKYTVPEGGLYTVVHVGMDGDEFVKKIVKATGVLFVPGRGFGCSIGEGVRVSYGPLVDNTEKIREGMRRVGEYLGRV